MNYYYYYYYLFIFLPWAPPPPVLWSPRIVITFHPLTTALRKWTHYQELSHVQRLRYLWSTTICNCTSAIVIQPALSLRVLYPDYFSCKALIGRPIVKYVFVQ